MGIRWEVLAKGEGCDDRPSPQGWEGGVGVKEETARASSTVRFIGPPAVSLTAERRRQLKGCKNGEEVGRRAREGNQSRYPVMYRPQVVELPYR